MPNLKVRCCIRPFFEISVVTFAQEEKREMETQLLAENHGMIVEVAKRLQESEGAVSEDVSC